MKNNRATALLMLLVFLLVAAVVIIFLTGLDRTPGQNNTGNNIENVTISGDTGLTVETPSPSVEPTTMPTTAPTYYAPSTTQPVQTVRPIAAATPTQAAATPSPTPAAAGGSDANMVPAEELIPSTSASSGAGTGSEFTTIPVGTSLGSGTFRSETGTSIDIHADWSAVVSGVNTADITVSVYVDSYSLYTTASPNVLNIAVDGQYVSLASPAIEYDGTNGRRSTAINERTFTVSLISGDLRSIPVEVVWNYRGTYGSTYLETIECGGTITLSR